MSVSRRELVKSVALAPLAGAAWQLIGAPAWAASQRHTLEFRPCAFVVDGKPVFLRIGSMDYFRCPHGEWRAQLMRAKRSGLNAIAFYVAWNFHEREEGVFTFEGDADIGAFIDLCGELGLYVFPRVGPFICGEWEAAGHPAWLYAKDDVELRSAHPTTLACVRKWFGKLIPILAQRQVTRGGPVLLVQQENEYYFAGRPNVKDYQAKLVSMIREFGIEVPVTDCNGGRADTRIAESFMTQNSGGADAIARIRKVQPQKPAIISELYTDYSNTWGWPVTSWPTAAGVYQQTVDTLSVGGMFNYFMFYGGTSFGFWAASTWKSDESFVTTRYYSRGPVAEGGALTDAFWVTKAANYLARVAEPFMTSSEPAPFPASLSGPVRGTAMRGPRGYLLFVHPQYPDRTSSVYHMDGNSGPVIQTADDWPLAEIATQPGSLRLPSGEEFDVAEPSSYPSMLPYQLEIDPGTRIDHSNATLLGLAGKPGTRVLLLRGEAGRKGIVSINGKHAEFVFRADAPARLELEGVSVVGLARTLADRTWFVDERVIIGPHYVGEAQGTRHVCLLDGEVDRVHMISAHGEIDAVQVTVPATLTARIPLTSWTARPLPEPRLPANAWRQIDGPVCVEKLRAYYGYTWYRATVQSASARSTGLFFTDTSDRVTVYVNAKRAGVWGHGPGATRDPLPIELAAGKNEIVMLCDNMGRFSEGSTPDRKGIRGPACIDAGVRDLPAPHHSQPASLPSKSWRFQTYHYFSKAWSLSLGSDAPPPVDLSELHTVTYELERDASEGLVFSLLAFPAYAWVLVDGKVVGEHSGDLSIADGRSYSTFKLDPHFSGRNARLDIVFYGEPPPDLQAHFRLYSVAKQGELVDWGFRAWVDPSLAGEALQDEPTWWTTEIGKPAFAGPYFLVTEGLSKGQAYLNGRALGRYWEIGPQHALYVPQSWLQPVNRIAIFDEHGRRPDTVYLMRDARVPGETVLL
ncbi:MAG: beta-galactosidase [Pseudomonadota bacterium]